MVSPPAAAGAVGAHVLVVDDDEPITAALRRALEYEGLRVSVARDGYTALELVRRDPPDLVVLDVMLPGPSGIEVCQKMRAENVGSDSSPVLVLMLTARDATADRVRGLDAGADDYLVKPFAYEELLARVRALLRRRLPSTEQRRSFADLVLDPLGRQAYRGSRELGLTALEFDLLAYFLAHPRQVLTRAQLLEAVWRMPPATASNVVDVYVGYLRAKLEADGEPRLLHTVRGVGYVLRAG